METLIKMMLIIISLTHMKNHQSQVKKRKKRRIRKKKRKKKRRKIKKKIEKILKVNRTKLNIMKRMMILNMKLNRSSLKK